VEPRSSLVSRISFRLNPSVLALVVGGAAAVPAVGFLGQRPGRQAGAPLIVQAADGVAVAVGQHGRAVRPLQPFGEQDRTEAGRLVGVDFHREPHALQPGLDGLGQIPVDVGLMAGILRGAGDRHQRREVVAEAVGVEIGQSARQGAVPRWHVRVLRLSPAG
jgi:hypothetical protein